jgi:hypothetical protein
MSAKSIELDEEQIEYFLEQIHAKQSEDPEGMCIEVAGKDYWISVEKLVENDESDALVPVSEKE